MKKLLLLSLFTSSLALGMTKPPPPPAPKKALCGMVAMGDVSGKGSVPWLPANDLAEPYAHPSSYVASVIIVTWAQLEPTQGAFNFTAIDTAISAIQAYNVKYPGKPMVGKLRIFSGVNAPGWALKLDNGPVTVGLPTGSNGDLPHYWSATYRTEWQKLQTALASKYDTNPLMGEVAISGCSSISAEPFNEAMGTANKPAFLAAGRTDDAMHACLSGNIQDYAVWKLTPLDYTFNPARSVSSTATNNFADQTVMPAFRTQYGAMGVVANHGLQSPSADGSDPIFKEIQTLGAPVEFQTVSPGIDMGVAAAEGFTYNMTEFEMWNTKAAKGSANVTQDQLNSWNTQFKCK